MGLFSKDKDVLQTFKYGIWYKILIKEDTITFKEIGKSIILPRKSLKGIVVEGNLMMSTLTFLGEGTILGIVKDVPKPLAIRIQSDMSALINQ